MIIAACILGMVLLTYFFSAIEDKKHLAQFEPRSMNTETGIVVRLKRNAAGHYVFNGAINRQPVLFLVDTGATDVVIPAALAASLGLGRGAPRVAITANGTITVYDTAIDELTIGDIRLYNVTASINPAMQQQAVLLGMSALGQVEFTQQNNALILRQLY